MTKPRVERRSWIIALAALTSLIATLGVSRTGNAVLMGRILASDETTEDRFGYSVAISNDTAIVSAPGDAPQGFQSGSAYIFIKTPVSWSQQAKLVASDGVANASFGQQVAISGDLAIVGAPYATVNGTVTGAAYVFARSGTTWTQQAKLVAVDGHPFDYFGSTVSISGTTAVVGSPYSDVFDADSGAVYVFTSSGGSWTQQAKIVPADGRSGDLFGSSVSLDQDSLVAGAPSDDDDAIASGSAYVFLRTGATWQQQQKVHPADRADGDQFGAAVSIQGDTALIGAPDRDDRGLASGAAYVYLRSNGGVWTQIQKLSAADGAPGDFFGSAVAINSSGALVGAFLDDEGAPDTGSVYAYQRAGNTFTLGEKLLANDRAGSDNFGVSVALSGNRVLIGSEQSDAAGSNAGAAYFTTVFVPSVPALGTSPRLALLGLLLAAGAAYLLARRRRIDS